MDGKKKRFFEPISPPWPKKRVRNDYEEGFPSGSEFDMLFPSVERAQPQPQAPSEAQQQPQPEVQPQAQQQSTSAPAPAPAPVEFTDTIFNKTVSSSEEGMFLHWLKRQPFIVTISTQSLKHT